VIKTKHYFIALIVISLCMTGCSRKTDVKEVGEGIYGVTASSYLSSGSRAAAFEEALEIAKEYCKETFNHVPWVTKITYRKSRPQSKAVFTDIEFVCLEEGDPELERLSKIKVEIEDKTKKLPDPFAGLFKDTKPKY